MIALTARFTVTSPMFVGSADPRQPRLRGPAFKAELRAWARAWNPEFQTKEETWFGGVGEDEGQSAVRLMMLPNGNPTTEVWEEKLVSPWRLERVNGVQYLGYSMLLPGNRDRRFILPNNQFTLRLLVLDPTRLAADGWRTLLAGVWSLGHLGAVGSRARRGFGSVQLTAWDLQGTLPGGWEPLSLPIVWNTRTPKEASDALAATFRKLRGWFGAPAAGAQHEHFGPRSRAALIAAGGVARGGAPWLAPLSTGGLTLQRFRAGHQPDKKRVLDHVLALNRRPDGRIIAGAAPDRVVFGLPLTFRFLAPKGLRPDRVEFTPMGTSAEGAGTRSSTRLRPKQRHASPLRLRVLRVGGKDFVLFLCLDGRRPGDTGVELRKDVPTGLSAPQGDLLRRFFEALPRETVHVWGGGQ